MTEKDEKDVSPIKGKPCKVCGQPSSARHTILFFVDNGLGWMKELVHLCESHAENMDSDDIDDLYIRSRISHLSRVRLNKTKSKNDKSRKIRKDQKGA
jgi:hypothetical protein